MPSFRTILTYLYVVASFCFDDANVNVRFNNLNDSFENTLVFTNMMNANFRLEHFLFLWIIFIVQKLRTLHFHHSLIL